MPPHTLTDCRLAGIHHLPPAQWESLIGEARQLHFATLTSDIGTADTLAQVLHTLGRDLAFPSWYGHNLDALYDCLTDPDWLPGPGHLLLIGGVDALSQTTPDSWAHLLEVLGAASDARRDAGLPFWVVLDHPTPGVPAFPLA